MVSFRHHLLLSSVLIISQFSCSVTSIHSPPTSLAACDRSCGSHDVQYPFGFSPGCQIQLNCSGAGEMQLGGYRVSSLTSGSIFVDVPFACNRSVRAARALFGSNYAMKNTNFFFLRNCDTPNPCQISTDTLFRNLDNRVNPSSCRSGAGNVSCYAPGGNDRGALLRMDDVDVRDGAEGPCNLFTSFRYGATESSETSLVFGSVELAWWLNGTSCDCSANANSTVVDTVAAGQKGCRCTCAPGFSGDGFRDGCGCFKDNCQGVSYYVSSECKHSIRVGLLVGGLIAAASVTLALACLCHHGRRRYVAFRNHKTTQRLLSQRLLSSVAVYSYPDIESATGNFSKSHRLGTGAYGTVYLGRFPGGELVAIKRLRHRDTTDNLNQVVNEIRLISSVSHPNLVQLLGCCVDKGAQILVYEFVPNGTLCQHIRRQRGGGLPWPARVAIAADTAKAVAYLHNSVNPPIYHRDIKSSNILLDDDLRPKLADFGLSRMAMTELSHISTAPQGTPGYVDPLYHQQFHLSDKSDVYSFGVVLVEMLTAMKAVDFDRAPNEVNLASLAVDRIGRGLLGDIVDPLVLAGAAGDVDASVQKVAELAFRCLAFNKDARPCMAEVAEELERIRAQVFESAAQDGGWKNEVAERVPAKSGGDYVLGMKAAAEEVVSPVTVQAQWVSESSSSASSSCSLSNAPAQHRPTFGMQFY